MQIDVDIRNVPADEFRRLAHHWRDTLVAQDRELPLSVFKGAGLFDLDMVESLLQKQFS